MPDLVDMKRSASDMESDTACAPGKPDPYPYGLCLNVDKDELDKLGITSLPEVGEEYQVMAVAKVTRVNASAAEGQDDQMGVSLQITSMALESTGVKPKVARGAKTVLDNAYRNTGEGEED